MERVRSFFLTFSKSEQQAFQKYLEAFHQKGPNKSLEFLELLSENPEITQGDAAEALYGDGKSKAFIMLKSRLLEKMVEFSMLSVNPSGPKPDPDSPFSFELIEFRRQMLFGAVFRARRLNSLAEECLSKAAEIARECECPELEIDALLRLRALRSIRAEDEELDGITARIREAIPKQNADINGVIAYQRFLEKHTLRLSDDGAKIQFLEEHIPHLQGMLDSQYSLRADYYLQTLKSNYYSIVGDYEAGKETILSIINLVANNKALMNRQRMATPFLQLGLLEMKFQKYKEAVDALDACRQHLNPKNIGHFRASVIKMYAYIYLNDLRSLDKLVSELNKAAEEPSIKNSPRWVGMFTYLLSCVEYVKGNPMRAYQILQEITEMNFDKGGWLTGIRIFEIMLLVELGELDMAMLKLESLRKHLARYEADERAKTIFKLLMALNRVDFNFGEVKREEAILEQLENEHPWVDLGSEVIKFEDWYRKMQAQGA